MINGYRKEKQMIRIKNIMCECAYTHRIQSMNKVCIAFEHT